MSIARIYLNNFKQFADFGVSARSHNILVGPNNSGKSTVLDTLRLLQACLRYSRSRTPTLFTVPIYGVVAGYEIPQSWLPIPIANVARNYSDDPATIEITHANKSKIRMEFHPDHVSRFYFSDGLHTPRTGAAFRAAFPCSLLIVPPLSPFEENERPVSDETVSKNRSTRLAARNFRNIWQRSSEEEFAEFATLVSASWPDTTIERPYRDLGDTPLVMMYAEKRIPREIYWSGYGFQVWLQLLMHLLSADSDAIFVIDEPDIYLHADLQKRLYQIIEGRFSQHFIATHSTEIINDVEIGSIISIDRDKKTARRVNSDDQYQALYNYIGSKENSELAKLARAQRVIFFEGTDKKILKKFARKTRFDVIVRDTDTLIIAAGGFSQWKRVEATAWALKEVLGIEAKIFSVFDRDYRCLGEIEELQSGLERAGIKCMIWECKEIENYALDANAIHRVVAKKLKSNNQDRTLVEIEHDLMHITDFYGSYVRDQCLGHSKEYHGGKGGDHEAHGRLSKWKSLRGRLEIGPGKKILSDICGFYKREFDVSLSLFSLVDELREDEMRDDMLSVLSEINEFCTGEVTATLRAIDAEHH